jgi:hypothetical protein
MGQFSNYIEHRTRPPAGVLRVFSVVAPILMIVRAVGSRRLEDILTAVWFVVLLLPAGIAPGAYYARLAALGRRPGLGAVLMFLMMSTGAFVLLAEILPRTTSAVIGVLFGLVLTVTSHLVRRRRT